MRPRPATSPLTSLDRRYLRLTRYRIGHESVALQCLSNGKDQVSRQAGLGDVTRGPSGEGRSNKIPIFMNSHEYDFDAGIYLLDTPCGLKPVQKRHRNIGHEHVGVQR